MKLGMGNLKKIKINSFKNQNVNISIDINNSISVIYGENGIGKTSILNILYDVLNEESNYLIEYKVSKVELTFDNGNLIVKRVEPLKYEWSSENQLSSIYFNISRYSSASEKTNRIPLADLYDFFYRYVTNQTSLPFFNEKTNLNLNEKQAKDLALELSSFLQKKTIIRTTEFKRHRIFNHRHVLVENFDLRDLIGILKNSHKEYVEYIKQNLYSAVAHLLSRLNYKSEQSDDFTRINNHDLEKYIYPNRNVIDKYLTNILFIKSYNLDKNVNNDKLTTSILIEFIRLIKESYEANTKIISLIEYYNEFLNDNQTSILNKELIITEDELKIVIGKNISHSIYKLSSGERQFLLLLTIILISNKKDFIIIDEPESSLHATWKRKLLPFLAKISDSQIIVASHSSTLASNHDNSHVINYLCKIEISENEEKY